MKMRLRRLTSVLLVIMMLINMFPAYADGIEQSNSTDWINYYKTKENGVPYSINPLLQHHFSKNTEESPENDGSAKVTVQLQIPFSELVQGENEIVTQLVLTKEQLEKIIG